MANETKLKDQLCKICGKEAKLSSEHVPPRSALNEGDYIEHTPLIDKEKNRVAWDKEYIESRGISVVSLCERCNNWTGSVYGQHYAKLIKDVAPFVKTDLADSNIECTLRGLFPLRIIKQVVSLFLSTSEPTDFKEHDFIGSQKHKPKGFDDLNLDFPSEEELEKVYAGLKAFVLDKNSKELPKKVKIQMFASLGSTGFRTGVFCYANLSSGQVLVATVVGLHPIHWVLSISGEPKEGLLDVTDWAQKYGYQDSVTLELKIPCRWLVGKYPLDFRSPPDLNVGNFLNNMKALGFQTDLSGDDAINEAISFAKQFGEQDERGYFISEFEHGVFYEYEQLNGWIPEGSKQDAEMLIMHRIENRSF